MSVLGPQQSRDAIDFLVAGAQILGSLATAGAFWVTFITLKELKRQTDLANNPILKLRFRYFDTLQNKQARILTEHLDNHPFDSWRQIITRNLQQDITGLQESFLVIEFTNSGKSEITKIKFTLNLIVSMFDNDILGYEIAPTSYTWEDDLQVELGEKDTILLPITNSRYFPRFSGKVENLSFVDIRGNIFTNYDGSSTFEKTNEILRPVRPPENEILAHSEPEPPPEPDVPPEYIPPPEPPIPEDYENDIPF